MEILLNDWPLLVAGTCIFIAVVSGAIYFFKLPTATQLANIKEWLKFAVVEAEKELGSGTGKLKLRMVYDMAIDKFPWLSKRVSFDLFSVWVDDALVWMRDVLSSNDAIQCIVMGDEDLVSVKINETDDCK